MTTEVAEHRMSAPTELGDYEPYRALSKAAIASVVLGLLGLLGLLFPVLLVLPLIGLLCSWTALRNLRRYPLELAGRSLAITGLVLCSLLLVGGVATRAVIYATEVPEGYERIAFSALKAGNDEPDVPTSDALALDGKRLFIKGYLFPGDQQENIRRFVLVGDLGTCCFGKQPKLTHMIEVTLRDPLRAEYSYRKRAVGGTLKVSTKKKATSGLGGVYYQLDADYFK